MISLRISNRLWHSNSKPSEPQIDPDAKIDMISTHVLARSTLESVIFALLAQTVAHPCAKLAGFGIRAYAWQIEYN